MYDAETTVDPTDPDTLFGELNVSRTTEDGNGHGFAFTLSAADGVPMPESSQVSVYYSAGETGTKPIPFGEITYRTTGIYYYTINEEFCGSGWIPDGNPLFVTVTVTDNGNGTLNVSVDGGSIVNEYCPVPAEVNASAAGNPFGKVCVSKTTEDDRGHSFSFTLSSDEGIPMPDRFQESVSFIAWETGEKEIPFGWITYTEAGTYEYTIEEDSCGDGWTVTDSPIYVTVVVTDNGNGTLSAEISGGTITNRYDAEATVDPTDPDTLFGELNVSRTTEDGNGHEFAFTLSADDGVPMPAGNQASVCYAAGETGIREIPFGEIRYTAAGYYYYTITEDTWDSGWSVTDNPVYVTVVVMDNGDGTLNASVTGGTIIYEYTPEPVSADLSDGSSPAGVISVSKTAEDGREHGFGFILSAVDNAPMPDYFQTVVNYGAGETGEKIIPFGWITFTEAGTYEYTIDEESCDGGWTTTDSPLNVTVNVTDNGNGTLSAAVTGGTMTYRYDAEAIVDPAEFGAEFGLFNLTRTTENGEGHMFSFALNAADGAPMPSTAQASVSYAAGETGTKAIPFGTITYTAAGIYEYTITETTENHTPVNGWSVLHSPVTVMVEVTDNGDGTLNVNVTGGEIKNEYNAGLTAGVPCIVSAASGEKTYVSFTAETAGVYRIAVDTGIATLVSVYAESDGELSELYTDYNSIDNLPFQAGETRYFSVRLSDGFIDSEVNVSIEHQGSVQVLNPNETTGAAVEESKQAYFMFTPAESGNYCFTSLGDEDTYGYLYKLTNGRLQETMLNDDGGEDNNFLVAFSADAGETVYLGARYYNETEGSFDVIVKPYSGLVAEIAGDREVYQVYGRSSILTVRASSGQGELTWKWMRRVDGLIVPIDGADGNTLTVPADIMELTEYLCEVSDGTETQYLWFTVVPRDEFEEVRPEDNNQYPVVAPGEAAELSVTAVTASNLHTYQWYAEKHIEVSGEEMSYMEPIPGAVSSTYCAEGIEKFGRYVCRVTSPVNGEFQEVEFCVNVSCDMNLTADTEPDITVTAGGSATMKVKAETESERVTYRWLKMNRFGEWKEIDGAEEDTYTAVNVQRISRFRCDADNGYGAISSIEFTVWIENNVQASAVSGEQITVDAGGGCNLEAGAGSDDGSSEFSYQWYGPVSTEDEEGSAISGVTGSVLELTDIRHNAVYYCVVQDQHAFCDRVYFHVMVDNDFHAEPVSDWVYIDHGETAEISVNAGCRDGELSYQWYGPVADGCSESEAETIEDAVTETYQVTQWTSHCDIYLCTVSDQYGNTVTLLFHASISGNLEASATDGEQSRTVGYDQDTTLSVEAQSYGTVTYQWFRWASVNDYLNCWVPVENETGSILAVEHITKPEQYMCKVKDAIGNWERVDFWIEIHNDLQVSADAADYFTRADEPVTLHVTATCIGGEISYQWYAEVRDDYGSSSFRAIEGETEETLVVSSHEFNGRQFFCRVTDHTGETAESDRMFIQVDNNLTTENEDTTIYVNPGESAVLTVTANSYDNVIFYTWYRDETEIPGATGNSYTIENAERSASYRCCVMDRFGAEGNVCFALAIENGLYAGAVTESQAVTPGSSAVMEVTAGSNSGGSFSYRWSIYEPYYDEYNCWHEYRVIDGATEAAYSSGAISRYSQYRCDVQDEYGNTVGVEFYITIDNHMVAEAVQETQTVSPNATAVMEVSASCHTGTLSYQWSKWTYITDEEVPPYWTWRDIEGATEESYTSEPITGYTSYICTVQDEYGNQADVRFVVYVDNHLTAEAFVKDLTAAPDETVTMKVVAGCDAGTMTYEWYRESYYDIDGSHEREKLDETGAICEVAATRNVQYKCHVQDQYGGERDVWFNVTVENHFTAVAEQEDMYVAPNAAANMQVNAGCDKGRLAYQWYRPAYTDEDGSWHDNEVIEGVTGATYTSDAITNYSRYYCRVNDEYGHIENVWFYIRVANHLTAEAVQDELTVNYNQTATLEVNASCDDDVLTYRWYRGNYVDEEGWYHDNELIEGAAGASYTTEPMTRFRWYYCDVLDQYGNQEQVSFNVTVENHFTAEAVQSHLTIQPGETASLEVRAGCDNGSVIYRWYRQEYDYQWGEWNIYPLDTEPDLAVYETEPLTRYADYTCVATDQYGKEIYVEFSVSIDNHFTAGTNQEQEMEIIPGDEISMEVYASCARGSISYQWYKRGYDKLEGWSYAIPITGENGTAYTSDPVTEYTVYYCHVEDTYGNNVNIYFRLAIWDEPSYVWAKDFGSVRATRNGKGYSIPEQNESVVTTYQVTVSPTDEDPGKAVYTANFSNSAFAQQQKERTIQATGGMTKLFLPGQIRNIEEEAFAGGAFQVVVIPDSCTSIGSRAFADCPNLLYVRIPASVTSLADDAFAGCSQVIIDDQRSN